MSEPDPATTTQILLRVCEGDKGAIDELWPRVYEELRHRAQRALDREGPGHTLQATALIHEAYLRLVEQNHRALDSRAHFVAVAGRCMRQILVDHARRRGAAKRGGERARVTLDEALASFESRNLDILALDEALEKLESHDKRKCRVVELRLFGGLSVEEVAAALRTSPRTVAADWYFARAWLARNLAS